MSETSWATLDAQQPMGSISKQTTVQWNIEGMGVEIINKEGGKWKGSYNEREWKKWWAREYRIKSERVLVIPVSNIVNLT